MAKRILGSTSQFLSHPMAVLEWEQYPDPNEPAVMQRGDLVGYVDLGEPFNLAGNPEATILHEFSGSFFPGPGSHRFAPAIQLDFYIDPDDMDIVDHFRAGKPYTIATDVFDVGAEPQVFHGYCRRRTDYAEPGKTVRSTVELDRMRIITRVDAGG